MKTGILLGAAALSLGLLGLSGNADARDHHRHDRRHGGVHVGIDLGLRHYRVAPGYSYDYRYSDDDYAYGDYGYGGYYYGAPYGYVDTYYVRTPRIVVRHRDHWRGHYYRHHHR